MRCSVHFFRTPVPVDLFSRWRQSLRQVDLSLSFEVAYLQVVLSCLRALCALGKGGITLRLSTLIGEKVSFTLCIVESLDIESCLLEDGEADRWKRISGELGPVLSCSTVFVAAGSSDSKCSRFFNLIVFVVENNAYLFDVSWIGKHGKELLAVARRGYRGRKKSTA